MKSQSAGEQTITKRVVDDIFPSRARGGVESRHQLCPDVEVFGSVRTNRWLAGCAARRVKSHEFFDGDDHHPKWIMVAQILFGRERKFANVLKRFDVAGLDAAFVKRFFVKRNLVVNAFDGLLQPLELQFFQLVARHGLGFSVPDQQRLFYFAYSDFLIRFFILTRSSHQINSKSRRTLQPADSAARCLAKCKYVCQCEPHTPKIRDRGGIGGQVFVDAHPFASFRG